MKAGAGGQARAAGPWPLLMLLATLAPGAIFPDELGAFKKGPPKSIAVPDPLLLDEFGLAATEQVVYKSPAKSFNATAWRFKDSTGAMAFFEAHRPPGATPAPIPKLTARTSDGLIQAYGNYVFQFTGALPDSGDLSNLFRMVPLIEQSALPALITFLPPGNPSASLVPNSERYVLGPVSLERFEPRIAPSVAAFHFGTEAQLGKYRTGKGPMALSVFKYPTPAIARDRLEEFRKIPGAMAKRVGPLVAIIIDPPDLDEAERVLAQVRYEANLTWNEKVPENFGKGLANMLLSIFALAGIIMGLCIMAGIGFGAFRVLGRKLGFIQDTDAMITLRLDGK